MPYMIVGNCVHKQNANGSAGETVPGGCHDNPEEAKKHMRALYANVKNSEISEFSLTVVKASYDKAEPDPNKKRRILMVSSDTSPDLYEESMSLDLFKDFLSHIQNNDPIPEQFKSAVCEDSWCGGMPYISIAHYRAGSDAKNVPGEIESVYLDGNKLKSKAFLHDTPLGRKLFDALCDDLEKHKSNSDPEHLPVRVSIGFLDLEHVHEVEGKTVTFTRTELGQKCALCEQGMGGKIYKKGYLVHEAATRVPVNQRTEMALEEKSMNIVTKHDDAESIVGKDLAEELEQKSLADDVLVVKADGTETNTPAVESMKDCYDPNTDSFDQKCINAKMEKWMTDMRNEMHTVKSDVMDVVYDALGMTEEARRKDVSDADKKSAEKKYGDVKYADEENKKYPIDTEEHIRAAWNYIHQQKNADKYPDHGAAIKKKIIAAWKRVIGGEPPSAEKSRALEDVMDAIVTDAKVKESDENPEEEKKETPEEEKKEQMKGKSALDVQFEALKSALASGKSLTEVQATFNELGKEVEKSLAPASNNPADLAEIVKSAVEAAVAPLRVELATLKAGQVTKSVNTFENPVSRALNLRQGDLLNQKSATEQPQLSQIQQIARKSVGM